MGEEVSKHFLRRTARAKAKWLDGNDPTSNYIVKRNYGRLFKWKVVRVAKKAWVDPSKAGFGGA